MTYPKVNVSVFFFPTKLGTKPKIMIDDSVDLTELSQLEWIFMPTKFGCPKEALMDVFDDGIYDIFFHDNQKIIYSINEQAVPTSGVIFGHKH